MSFDDLRNHWQEDNTQEHPTIGGFSQSQTQFTGFNEQLDYNPFDEGANSTVPLETAGTGTKSKGYGSAELESTLQDKKEFKSNVSQESSYVTRDYSTIISSQHNGYNTVNDSFISPLQVSPEVYFPKLVDAFDDPLSGEYEIEPEKQTIEQEKIDPPKDRPLTVSRVLDGVKVGLGLSGHVEYPIQTITSSPSFRNNQFTSIRRYSDFVWLYNQLTNKYPGMFIPPIPGKSAISKFQQEFLQHRKQCLGYFLDNLNSSTTFQFDVDVIDFLQSETHQQDRKSFMPLLSGEIVPMMDHHFPSIDEGDKYFMEKREWFIALELQLGELAKALDSYKTIVKSNNICLQDYSLNHDQFGKSLQDLTTAPVSNKLRQKLGKLSQIESQIKEYFTLLDLFGKIDEYVAFHLLMIGSVKIQFLLKQQNEKNLKNAKQNYDKQAQKVSNLKKTLTPIDVFEKEKKLEQETRNSYHQAQSLLNIFNDTLKGSIEAYEKERLRDCRAGIEHFLKKYQEFENFKISLYSQF